MSEFYTKHKFVNGRCRKCQIKPDYLMEYINAYKQGNITKEHLISISDCHKEVLGDE